MILLGWGRKLPQGPFSDIMQMNKNLEISPSDCRSRTIENGVICAGKPQSNLCEGTHVSYSFLTILQVTWEALWSEMEARVIGISKLESLLKWLEIVEP